MTAPVLSSAHQEMLSDLSKAASARLLVPWSESSARRMQPDHSDSRTPRQSIEQRIELALLAGQASPWAQDWTSLDGSRADEQADAEWAPMRRAHWGTRADEQADAESAPMRRAYRGRRAYTECEPGACGKRVLVDDLDPRWAYLNAVSVG